jgi:N-acylneuraminate cytidylyltransferase
MSNKNAKIAIVPARGGSKRIPRKNIKLFLGEPLISYSIKAALESNIFDKVYVSTDDIEIATIAASFGAEIPFLRDPVFANDNTMTVQVIADFLDRISAVDETAVCCIYPTAPLINIESILEGLNLLSNQDDINYVAAITKYNYPIQRAIKSIGSNKYTMAIPENLEKRSQDLDEYWHDAGMFYWAYSKTWKSQVSMLLNCGGVVIPSYLSQDIDDQEDWIRAEQLFKLNRKLF